MINLSGRLDHPVASSLLPAAANTASSPSSSSSTSCQSFAAELVAAFSQTPSQSAVASSIVQVKAADTGSQNSGGSQTSVAGSGTSSSPSAAVTPTSVAPTTTQPVQSQPVSSEAQSQTASITVPSETSDPPQSYIGSAADEAFDNNYWAQQPAEVQQLQNIQDPAQRTQLATQLAEQGYTIDVPIMVWGWDPGATMQLRQSDGYTWVPSALQQPVEAAPGITGQGITPYDPNNPPAGSISV